jgi:glycosyltransferase involved in cell wall biosynthesis
MSDGNRKLNVLFLASWYPSKLNKVEGIFIKKHALAASVFSDVSVLYVAMDRELKKKYDVCVETEDGILTVRVFFSKPKNRLPLFSFFSNILRYAGSIRRGLKEIKARRGLPDVVQLNVASRLGLAALYLKYIKRIPYFIVEHASTFIKFKDRQEYMSRVPLAERIIIYLNYKHADAIAGVSSFLAGGISKLLKLKKNAYILPNVVNIPEADSQRGENASSLRLLTIALLNKDKNIHELISAFSHTARALKDAELHIIGDGSEKTNLEKQAESLGLLNKNIFFYGYVPNDALDKYFAICNVFILPSKYETFSVVTAEALAHGLPVLITRCGGPEDFVGEDQGIKIEGFDEDSIAGAIKLMSSRWRSYNPEFLKEYAREHFSREAVGFKLRKLYEDVLKAKVK